MRQYSASGNRTASTTAGSDTLIQLLQPASALKRLALKFIEIHSDATADNAFTVMIKRVTAAGSGGTTFTPTLLDPADGAASAVVRLNDTTDPTITASSQLLQLGGHQRSTVMWYAPDGGALVVPVTNNAGLVSQWTTLSAGFNQCHTFVWEE